MLTEQERELVDFARIATDAELISEIDMKLERGLEINNSGLFRIAEILINEFVRRRPDVARRPDMADLRKALRDAIVATGRHGDNEYSKG